VREAAPTSVELFSGGGGLALGVHLAGFQHLLLVELDPVACETVRANNLRGALDPQWPIDEADIHGYDLDKFAGRVDLLAAGAPCQPFSLGGVHRGDDDPRNLFPEAVRAVREVAPKAVILENVKGLTRPSFFPYFEYVLRQLARPSVKLRGGEEWRDHSDRLLRSRAPLEYRVIHGIVDAANYGVPQRRDRVVLLAARDDLGVDPSLPEPTHSAEALVYSKWVERSYWSEHGLPEPLVPSELDATVQRLKDAGKPMAERWRTLRDALRGLPAPVDGEEHGTIANHVGIPGARRYKGHEGSALDDPAKTLKAGVHGVPGGEGTVLLDDGSVRYLSVREAARVQSFPDKYVFAGSRTRAMRQIGNAVPVRLAEALGLHVRRVVGV
jgi:DNA (cytosine-5)-methyltransferase 1